MIRTMIYLPEALHRALKHLAVERNTSLTELIRESAEVLYQEDLKDLRIGGQRLKEYLAHPERGVSYPAYRQRRHRRAA